MKRMLYIILILHALTAACEAGQPKKEVREGNLLYNEGKYKEALRLYEDAVLSSPESDIVNFNLGDALYKTGDYEGAISHFEKALVSDDEKIEQGAGYNLGNTKYRAGIAKEQTALPEAVNLLKEALHHYEQALQLDSEDGDALYNYEFVKKELKRLEQNLEKQKEEKGKEGEEKGKEGEEEGEKGEEEGEEKKEGQQAGAEDEEVGEEKEEAQSAEGEQAEKSVDEKQALMMLQNYSREEEPGRLYREKLPAGKMPGLKKDW